MELFNKYKNKNFTFITNYINSCINDESLTLTEDELREQLSGASQSTFEEFVLALTNAYTDNSDVNAAILYENDQSNSLLPLRQINVPIRATIAEKAWLYYILQNSKSDLFLSPTTKEKLVSALEDDFDNNRYPIKFDYIDIRTLSADTKSDFSTEYVNNFKMIVSAIKQHRTLTVTNNSFSGKIYTQQIVPYKIEYALQLDSFSLSCFPLNTKRPVKMNLSNISDISIGETLENYDEYLNDFKKQLRETKEKCPVTIEIQNQAEAYDRCAYLFSSYDTFCYDKGNDTLIMNIYYYRFQKEEIVRNILFLGRYVQVVAPENIVDDVSSSIKKAYMNYAD
ncbi:WYL domain-containing protein [Acetobacterium fimetarium]|uniref:WYL domain-containing protein n=1 Tax=Acetobacterium fimetarium TaxID=52691 RepID=A0ABR6WSQ4_9FIRM|nr:WYL domain-containing protein [Acetobacterium fimetarium]MBC3803558.1 WYL domain-containing protein [Acetobacterium fimetarium]